MNVFLIWIFFFVFFVGLCVMVIYWVVMLLVCEVLLFVVVVWLLICIEDVVVFFGGQFDKNFVQDIYLFGIFVFDYGGVVIVGVGGELLCVVLFGVDVMFGVKFVEVCLCLIIIDCNGVCVEIQFLVNMLFFVIYMC